MYVVTLISEEKEFNDTKRRYYCNCKNINDAHEIKNMFKMYVYFECRHFYKIKIRKSPYDESEGLYNKLISDSSIEYLKRNLFVSMKSMLSNTVIEDSIDI